MVTPSGDTDFGKLVNLCPVKRFSLISNPAFDALFYLITLWITHQAFVPTLTPEGPCYVFYVTRP